MFALFRAKNPYEQDSRRAYAAILRQVRKPEFYAACGVPDTLDGRFDLMVLHLFLVMDRALAEGRAGRDFNQALFDTAFADMDQMLREAGIGDMGVPKHMRRMMKGFNGRVDAYAKALDQDAAFEAALARNLFGTLETPALDALKVMRGYAQASRDLLRGCSFDDLKAGQLRFADIKANF